MPEHGRTPGPRDCVAHRSEAHVPAPPYPPLQASTASQNLHQLHLPEGPQPKRPLHGRRGEDQKDKPCPPARAQWEGWEMEGDQAAALTSSTPKNLAHASVCSSSNSITVTMTFCQHQHCRRLNGNTQCYSKGCLEKKKKKKAKEDVRDFKKIES